MPLSRGGIELGMIKLETLKPQSLRFQGKPPQEILHVSPGWVPLAENAGSFFLSQSYMDIEIEYVNLEEAGTTVPN